MAAGALALLIAIVLAGICTYERSGVEYVSARLNSGVALPDVGVALPDAVRRGASRPLQMDITLKTSNRASWVDSAPAARVEITANESFWAPPLKLLSGDTPVAVAVLQTALDVRYSLVDPDLLESKEYGIGRVMPGGTKLVEVAERSSKVGTVMC